MLDYVGSLEKELSGALFGSDIILNNGREKKWTKEKMLEFYMSFLYFFH